MTALWIHLALRVRRFRIWEYDAASQLSIHSPLRVETVSCSCSTSRLSSFNPLDPRGLRRWNDWKNSASQRLSIHSTLAGWDHSKFQSDPALEWLSIHSTLAGWDRQGAAGDTDNAGFQSTQPMRVETLPFSAGFRSGPSFNPLNPCGLRLQITAHFPKILPTFSIFFGSLRNLLTSYHSYGYSCKEFWCERPRDFMFTCLSHQAIYKFFGKFIAPSCPKKKMNCCKVITLYKPLLSHILVYLISPVK